MPSSYFEELAYFFGRNLHDHISTADANLMGGEPPRLERAVYYGGFRPESVAALEALAREHAMEALQALNKATLERTCSRLAAVCSHAKDHGRGAGKGSFAIGSC